MKKTLLYVSIISLVLVSGCSKNTEGPVSNAEPSVVIETNDVNTDDLSLVSDNADNPTDEKPIEEIKAANSEIRVICYGTSMVYGTGGGGVTLSNVIKRYSGADAINYGGYAEDTNCIAARLGANKLSLTEGFTIPADDTPVEIKFDSDFGQTDLLLKYTDAGLNPVTIDGICGDLSRDDEANIYFTRSEAGEEKAVEAGTEITPYSVSRMTPDDILIIWTSGNDNIEKSEDIPILLDKIDKMVAFGGNDRFVLFSDMNNHLMGDEINAAFREHYNEHFLDFKTYMMTDASNELGYPLDEDDLLDIEENMVPRCFRSDDEHGNSLYYLLAGQQVYKKCQKLGYLQ